MKSGAPSSVKNIEDFWVDKPDTQSDRCTWWVKRIAAGWRPNSRIHRLGYHEAADFYGVWIWEYIHVITPMLNAAMKSPVTLLGPR